MYNTAFLEQCNQAISAVLPQFDSKDFVQQVQDNAWDGMELKQRMRHLAVTLRRFLPESFPEAADVITAMMDYIIQHQQGLSFQYMFLPDIIEIYGLEQPDTAMMAFEKITRYSSCEFAIYYLLANGKHSKKIFKISEKSYDANSVATVKRRQSFKLITTRTFYPGSHRVTVIVNGRETDALPFLLISPQ